MTREEALLRLAGSTADAVGAVLDTLAPGQVERGSPTIVPRGASPFQSIPEPAIASSVSYVDGVTGGNVFVLSRFAARRLAALMMGGKAGEVEDGEMSELELSAVAEAMNQMMAAAAAGTSAVLGEEIAIGPPQTRTLARASEAESYELTPWSTSVSFTIAGEPGRFVQLVPNAFVVRMTKALDELGLELAGGPDVARRPGGLPPESVLGLAVRVSAELGRARLPIGRTVALDRCVVELDRTVDDPIEILVNGRPFAAGHLLVADGEWAVRIDEIRARPPGEGVPSTKEGVI